MSLRAHIEAATNTGAASPWEETVSYTPAGGSTADVDAVFDREHVSVLEDGTVSVAPALHVVLSRLASDPTSRDGSTAGDTFTYSGTTYEVVMIERTGNGDATLHSQAVS